MEKDVIIIGFIDPEMEAMHDMLVSAFAIVTEIHIGELAELIEVLDGVED